MCHTTCTTCTTQHVLLPTCTQHVTHNTCNSHNIKLITTCTTQYVPNITMLHVHNMYHYALRIMYHTLCTHTICTANMVFIICTKYVLSHLTVPRICTITLCTHSVNSDEVYRVVMHRVVHNVVIRST
jgi:hypothetical protein